MRNLEGLPTLADLTTDSVEKLAAIQKGMLAGFPNGGAVFTYSEIETMTKACGNSDLNHVVEQNTVNLLEKGICLNKDVYYSAVVSPALYEKHRFAYLNQNLAVLFNIAYEQLNFIYTQPGGNIMTALKGIRDILENCNQQGVKFSHSPTKGFTCCDLANLGTFRVKFTLNLRIPTPERQEKF